MGHSALYFRGRVIPLERELKIDSLIIKYHDYLGKTTSSMYLSLITGAAAKI